MNIIVVGGGASGMLASALAAESGASVLLFERNMKTGKKLLLTGKGRCNLTNNCTAMQAAENIPNGGRFLYSALTAFPPSDVMSLFESLGVRLKTERGNRVFPKSDKSFDVVKAMRSLMNKNGVIVRHDRVIGIRAENGKVAAVITKDATIEANAVILATGGLSYPDTGSTGDGYEMAKKLGHDIVPLRASLVPLNAEPEICARMQGLTLKNVRLTICDDSAKTVFQDFGELLFTHFGISGPMVLSASAHMRDYEKNKYSAAIDFKPALDDKKLDARILRDFTKFTNRDFCNSLHELLPTLSIPVIVERSGIPPRTKVNAITRLQRQNLLKQIKEFTINIDSPRPLEEAVVTSGGINLREINPKTMESKIVSNLYFAGEIIDADGYTGGFNLQIAWSTAYVAALAAAEKVKNEV